MAKTAKKTAKADVVNVETSKLLPQSVTNAIKSTTVKETSLAVMPVFGGDSKMQDAIMHYCGFVKGETTFNLPDVGEIDIEDLTFRLVDLQECFTRWEQKEQIYALADGQMDNDKDTHVAVVILCYKDNYYTKTITTRNSTTALTSKLYNLNLDAQSKLEGTKLDGRPYVIARATCSVAMKTASQSGYEYHSIRNFKALELEEEELNNFMEYLNTEEFVQSMKACIEKNNTFLGV